MGRIIEWDNRKYEIPDANFGVEYTDTNGRTYTFDQFWLFNPEAHKAFKLTTLLSVMKWWVNNRQSLEENLEYVYWTILLDSMSGFLDILRSYVQHESLETLKDFGRGFLREPSIQVIVHGASQQSGFVLFENEQTEEEVTKVNLHTRYNTRVIFEPVVNGAVGGGDQWTEHYNYSFRMDPSQFNWFRSVKKESSVMFGMELEVSSKLTTTEIQKIVREVEPKQDPFFIFKQDSSISGQYRHALEIVTVPCTPRYLRKNWKIFFQKLDRLCRNKGLVVGDVFDTSRSLSNGLHIHVSKDSFIDKPHYNKFLTSWNQWNKSVKNLFNAVADRPTDYARNSYCKINGVYDGMVLARRLKGLSCHDRQTVAHDTTGKTIEVRVYQGIVDLPHIMRCISFTEAVFEYCQNIGYSGFDKHFVPKMSKFVRQSRKYASLYSVFEKAASK